MDAPVLNSHDQSVVGALDTYRGVLLHRKKLHRSETCTASKCLFSDDQPIKFLHSNVVAINTKIVFKDG